MRILYVGPDTQLGRALAICLHAKGHHLDVVANVPRSARLITPHYDVMMYDLSEQATRDASSADLITELRKEGTTPVIALADRWKARQLEAPSTGADGWLEKPFALGQLLVCVQAPSGST